MSFLSDLFAKPPCPPHSREEVNRLIEELIVIGKKEDYLSETPGGSYNMQCRHIRTREIGKRLNQIGGWELMEFASYRIRRKLGKNMFDHLEYAWSEIGKWLA